MPITFKLSSDVIVGVLLITTGVFTFARGTSQHLADDNFKKSKEHIEKILKTVSNANIFINNNNNQEEEEEEVDN
jgi:hypothetical protein